MQGKGIKKEGGKGIQVGTEFFLESEKLLRSF